MTNDDWPPLHPQQRPGVEPNFWRGALLGTILAVILWLILGGIWWALS